MVSYFSHWVCRHSESSVEVERKKRQLESVKRQRREASDVDDVLEAGEVLLDQMEREVVRDVELEQEFSHLMEEEDADKVKAKNTLCSVTQRQNILCSSNMMTDTKKIRLEIGGRQAIRTNFVPPLPHLSCLVLDSMPKVQPYYVMRKKHQKYFSSGNWMYIAYANILS